MREESPRGRSATDATADEAEKEIEKDVEDTLTRSFSNIEDKVHNATKQTLREIPYIGKYAEKAPETTSRATEAGLVGARFGPGGAFVGLIAGGAYGLYKDLDDSMVLLATEAEEIPRGYEVTNLESSELGEIRAVKEVVDMAVDSDEETVRKESSLTQTVDMSKIEASFRDVSEAEEDKEGYTVYVEYERETLEVRLEEVEVSETQVDT